ncbi:MAG: hypothetical protein LUD51_03855 [Clostridia bacterium]|nr:hypothetical protein [Clostridia bacterium]
MDDLKLLYYEVMAATKRCREDGYTLASIDHALGCVANYYKALPAGSQKAAVGELLISLRKKKTITVESGLSDRPQTVSKKDLDALCPVTLSKDIDRPVLSVSYVIDTGVGRMYRDNAMILCGPFADELVYETKNFAKNCGMDFRFVDIEPFVKSGSFSKVLQLLQAYYSAGTQKDVIAYKGLEALADHDAEAKDFARMLRQMRLKAKSCTQILLSTDPSYYFNDLYVSLFDAPAVKSNILEDDFSVKALTFVYLPLPTYANVTQTVLSALHLAPADTSADETSDGPAAADTKDMEDYIKANCLPLACGTLTDLLKQSASPDAFREKANPVSLKRKRMLNSFLGKAGDSAASAIIDADWDYKKPARKKTLHPAGVLAPVKYTIPVTPYDYDCIDDISAIRASVQYVLDAQEDYEGNPISVMQKCGLVLRYALTNGDAMNLVNMTKDNEDEMKARWTLGYAALTQLLKVPTGNFVFDIPENSNMNGECCDGGQTVRFNRKFAKNPELAADGCNTLLHELFHAVQNEAVKALRKVEHRQGVNCDNELSTLEYYKYNFGISEFRIKEAWEDNTTRGYIESSKSYDGYHVQVFEADARVFADEAWAESEDAQLARMS